MPGCNTGRAQESAPVTTRNVRITLKTKPTQRLTAQRELELYRATCALEACVGGQRRVSAWLDDSFVELSRRLGNEMEVKLRNRLIRTAVGAEAIPGFVQMKFDDQALDSRT